MGELVPVLALECIPGDKFKISTDAMVRFAPLVSPVVHRMNVFFHYWFVPNRIQWEGWEDYIANKVDPDTQLLPAHPFVRIMGGNYTRLVNYFGIADPENLFPGNSNFEDVSPFAFGAYQRIWHEFYRDQNQIEEVELDLIDGNNNINIPKLFALRARAWEHDYFTSALPDPQAGAEVDIPLGDVVLKENWESDPERRPHFTDTNDNVLTGEVENSNFGGIPQINVITDPPGINRNAYDPSGTLEVQATTINDLRRAFKLQEWVERMQRGGRRLKEVLLAHFGVEPGDARLQRPEWIGGTMAPVMISEVLNTDGNIRPQGDMAGHGISVTDGAPASYFCREHGYIIGIMSIMPKTAYFQGVPRHFSKFTDPTEYYWPSFANIGEQEVKVKELYAFNGTANSEKTFGYMPRYAEYKTLPSLITGDFQTTLRHWHFGRFFDDQPALNQLFVQCNPTQLPFAVQDETVHKMICHIYHKIWSNRPMPKYGTPTI